MTDPTSSALGAFLRGRRERLDPAAFGFGEGRRRTPGLRREEVAQRANISPTWYTWLEQGRGGAPSADVLERIATGLMLTEPEREHMFMLALGRPPEPRYQPQTAVTPRLQRVLDSLSPSPAIIHTAIWDVLAWNEAAAALLTDYAQLPRMQRNILRLMFAGRHERMLADDRYSMARHVVAAFRADAARAGPGAAAEVAELVGELSQVSTAFATLWQSSEVASGADGIKRIHHPEAGLVEVEFSTFSVDGRPDLRMLVFNPTTSDGAGRILSLLENRAQGRRAAPGGAPALPGPTGSGPAEE